MISAINSPKIFSPNVCLRPDAFTLLEMIITLMIGTLIIGTCVPAFLHSSTERKLREASRGLGDMIVRARLEAIASGSSTHVAFTPAGFLHGKEKFGLEKGVRLRARIPGDTAWQTPGSKSLLINSSGLCEPWQFEFSLQDGSYLRYSVDPLIGVFNEEEFLIH
ncbi:MAG: hypothetical protein ABI615_01060 [Chthoniobacterales bacterium]